MITNLETIKAIIETLEADQVKFDNGTNSAGSRLRKGLQAVKKASNDMRAEILATQKAAKAKKSK